MTSELQRAVPGEHDLDPLLWAAVELAASSTGSDATCLYLPDEEDGDLVRQPALPGAVPVPERIPAGVWRDWWPGAAGGPVHPAPGDLTPGDEPDACSCTALLPLRGADGRIVGALGLAADPSVTLDHGELERLDVAGALVEHALERTQAIVSARRLAAAQSVVAALGQQEVEPGRLDDYLALAAERTRAALAVDWVAIVDLERERPVVRATAGRIDLAELGLDPGEGDRGATRRCLLSRIESADGPTFAVAASQRARELGTDERVFVESVTRTIGAAVERERSRLLAVGQAGALEAIARGEPLAVVLDLVCALVEAQAEGLSASVMLPDQDTSPGMLFVGAGPSLAPGYVEALSVGVPIGEGHGICGTAAARREAVIVEDVTTSPLCTDYVEAFDRFGLRACWSTPVEDAGGELLATFALYYDDSRAPSPRERRLIDLATSIVRVALERERAAARLAETTRTLAAIVDNAPLAFVALDPDGNVTVWSRAAEELFGWAAAEVLGGPLPTLLDEDRERIRGEHRRVLAGETLPVLEQRRRQRSGSVVDVAIARAPVYDEAGEPRSLLGIFTDVTERRRAELALRESEARFRSLVELMPDLVLIHEDSIVRYVNEAGLRLIGAASADEVIGRSLLDDVVAPEAREIARARLGLVKETSAPLPLIEQRWLRLDGTDVIVETASVATTHEGRPAIQVVARDVTQRKQTERELVAVGRRLQAVIAASPIAISSHDLEGRVTLWSPAAEQILGWSAEEVVGHVMPHLDAEEQARFQALRDRVIESGEPVRYETTRRRRDGAEITLSVFAAAIHDAAGEPLGTIGLFDDITERRRAEAEHAAFEARVQHAQKLESLGVLAGGIAHDFNNLLVGILGNLGLALAELEQDAPARPQVERAETAACRAAELTHQMLAYAGRASFEKARVDVSRLVRELGGLVEASALRQTVVHYALADDLPAVEGDRAQLQQVVLNLLTNAAESVGERSGEIRVETRLLPAGMPDDEPGLVGDPPAAGPCVLVQVADTGVGMDAETRERIFEPFFTTKFTGRGLGLAAVLGIVRAHEGAIGLRSEPGVGTTFRVFLPAAAAGVAEPASEPAGRRATGGTGSILVVDDEPEVLEVASLALGRAGYEVVTAGSGREAIELYTGRDQPFSLVLLDLTMPGMRGDETLEALRELDPDVRVLLTSGFSEEDTRARVDVDAIVGFIQKPYRPSALARRVAEAIRAS